MEFYQTKIGRTFFEHQIPQLIDALNGLAAALSSPAQAVHLPVSSDPHFLSELYFGSYEPEVYKVTPELRQLDTSVSDAHDALSNMLPEDSRVKLEAYELALTKRNAAVAEQAYESGVRAAMQMIAAGLSRPDTREEEN